MSLATEIAGKLNYLNTQDKNIINALAPYSGYTQVSKKLDNFVFQTSSSFLNKVADKNRFVKFGDKVVDTYGPELVTNGDFSNGTTGWTNATVVDGKLIKSSTNEYQLLLPDYKTVIITYTVSKYVASPSLRYFDTAFRVIHTALQVGTFSIVVTLPKVNGYLYIVGGEGSEIDNISVREIQTATLTNTVPDVAEVITNGSNTTSVQVNAGDYVVDGSELVTNGTFETVADGQVGHDNGDGTVDGWSVYGTITLSIENNKLKIYGTETSKAGIYIPTIAGQKYTITADLTSGTSTGSIIIYSGNFTSTAIQLVGNAFTATTSQTLISFRVPTSGTYFYVDNISVKRVSDTFRAKQDAPIGTALTNTTYFEDRPSLGVTNQALAYHAYNTLTNAYEGIKIEVLFNDVSKEQLLDNSVWMARNGFSKVSQFLYGNGSYNDLVSWQYTTLNKGLFHPLLNYMGTRKASDDKYWYDTTVSFTSVADCFNPTKLLTTSGNVASSKSGRPDGKYYDICYSDLVQDVREYAKILNRDEVNLIISDKEENGVEEVVSVFKNIIIGTSSYQILSSSGLTYISNGVINNTAVAPNVYPTFGTFIDLSGGLMFLSSTYELYRIQRWSNDYNLRIKKLVNGSWVDGEYANILGSYGTFTAIYPNDKYLLSLLPSVISYTTTKPILSSNTKLSIDLIGNPTNYPQVLKDRLASGVGVVGINPLLVGQDGTSYIYEDTDTSIETYNLCLSNKAIKGLQCVRSTDDVWSIPIRDASIGIDNMPNSTQWLEEIMLFSYTSKNNPYIQTTPKPVIDVEPKVIASNSHSIYKGALIGNQVSGKIQVGNGANGYESKVLEETGNVANYNSADGTVYISINQTVFLSNNKFGTGVNGRIYKRIGTSGTHDLSMQDYIGNTFNWSYVGDSGIYEIPTHSTIALDNANSPASKWFKAISQGTNGVVGSVFGKELAYNSATTSFDGDNELFDQLTNGTKTDLNAKTVRTFHGSIPINGEVK